MKNYINVRLENRNHTKELQDIKHNLRHIKSKSDIKKEGENNHYFYNKDEKIWKLQDEKNAYKLLLPKLKEMRKEHNKLYKEFSKEKRNLRARQSSFISGVITFSEKQEYLYDNGEMDIENFEKANIKAVEALAKKMNTEILYISFHYKEKTPHCQYHLKGYDDRGYSIFNKFKNRKDLSEMQDLAHNELIQYDETIQRGEKKYSEPNQKFERDHKDFKTYHEENLRIATKETKKQIKKELEELEILNQRKKAEMAELKERRKELKLIEMDKEEKKKEYAKITNLQKEIRDEQAKIREEKREINERWEAIKNKEAYIKNLEISAIADKMKDKEIEILERKLKGANDYENKIIQKLVKTVYLNDIEYMKEDADEYITHLDDKERKEIEEFITILENDKIKSFNDVYDLVELYKGDISLVSLVKLEKEEKLFYNNEKIGTYDKENNIYKIVNKNKLKNCINKIKREINTTEV